MDIKGVAWPFRMVHAQYELEIHKGSLYQYKWEEGFGAAAPKIV